VQPGVLFSSENEQANLHEDYKEAGTGAAALTVVIKQSFCA
jgi:hypothetical protein